MAVKSMMNELLMVGDAAKRLNERLNSDAEASLSEEERRRVGRIRKLLRKLDDGEDVQNRDLQKVLTPEQYQSMRDEWESVKGAVAPNKPESIKRYEELLKKALFAYSKGDAYSARGDSEKGLKFLHKADAMFEDLLIQHREIVEKEANAAMWFDRNEGDLDPASIPRIVTSRSLHNLRKSTSRRVRITKRDVKRDALSGALNELGLDP